jgi:hypothetical protein
MVASNTTLLADVLLIAMLIVLTSGSLLSGILSKIDIEVIAQQKGEPSSLSSLNIVTVQNTSMSKSAPNTPVNNQIIPHQIVVALPLREDGKIWTGMATFTASKPIEVDIVHKYNPQILPDTKHGAPYNAKWIDNTTRIAISTMTMFSNTPVIVTNSPISTGSLTFAGSALVFHKIDGQPFTVTYTIDAVAKPLIK